MGKKTKKKATLGEFLRRHQIETGMASRAMASEIGIAQSTVLRILRDQNYGLKAFSKAVDYLELDSKTIAALVSEA